MIDETTSEQHPTTRQILRLFADRGGSEYGGEAVTQLEHALQSAYFAEQAGASSSLIVAALLHDLGHLLHSLPDDAPEQGIDDRHEQLGAKWLRRWFGPEVVEPILLHVDAKRYLCGAEPDYLRRLSGPSLLSLRLQGGPFDDNEQAEFRKHPHFDAAVALRRFDDTAKIPNLTTPPLEHFAPLIDAVAAREQAT